MLGLGLFAVVVAVALTVRVHWLRYSGYPTGVSEQLRMSLKVTRSDVDAWVRSNEAQTALLARIAASTPGLGTAGTVGTLPGEALDDRARDPALPIGNDATRRVAFGRAFGGVMHALASSNAVDGCWVWDERGVLLAGSAMDAPPWPAPPLRTVGTPRGVAVEFAAPVVDGGVRRGTLVLRVAPSDSAFPNLNTMGRQSSAGRTTLLAPIGGSLVVAATQRVGAPPLADRRTAIASAPAFVRAALQGREENGVGRSFSMPDASYAAAPLPTLGWVAVREYDADAIRAQVTTPIVVEETMFGLLAAMGAAVTTALARGARLRRAGALARVRADFVAGVSHELRTPLAQIRMFAELLSKGALREPGEAERALGIIEKEAGRLSILVDNVLNFARLQRQAPPEVPRPADVADEARHVIDAFAPLAAERGVTTTADVPDGLRAAIDAQALRQVLINLLENGVKYGPRGQTVSLGARPDGARVRMWVDDEGPGIPVAERTSVFDAFRRGEHATRSDAPGSGLGLSVVRSLVEHHGGTVSAEEAPRGGARMVVALPRAAEG